MDPAAGGEGEVLRAGQLGDRDEVIGDDASGFNSPAGGGSYGDVGCGYRQYRKRPEQCVIQPGRSP
jgi:hypothetical protein